MAIRPLSRPDSSVHHFAAITSHGINPADVYLTNLATMDCRLGRCEVVALPTRTLPRELALQQPSRRTGLGEPDWTRATIPSRVLLESILEDIVDDAALQAGKPIQEIFDELPFQPVNGLSYGGVTFGFSVGGADLIGWRIAARIREPQAH